MLISLDWLKDFVDIDCTAEVLQDKLVKAGFEIEEIIRQGDNCKNVVVGKIERLEKHPDADKLQICDINVGKENVQIVTGANNVCVGNLVPVALDNSDLPNGMHIKKGKLRGVMSYGMLCSGAELKITEADYSGASVDGILILSDEYAVGTDINEVLKNNDIILDIGVTANRPDCNSVIGIAREVCAVLDKPMKMPSLNYRTCKDDCIESNLNVEIMSKDICPRYMAGLVKNVVIKESPSFIKRRLKAVGINSINNIVDITNYVLIEMGQPMHAFDYAVLDNCSIKVRNAKKDEKIVILNGSEVSLEDSVLVIADDNKPVAIAGIMGGKKSGISQTTSTIVFESAKFVRESIRRSSRRLNIKSDSSTRYERGIDLESQQIGLARALSLIDSTESGDIVKGIIDEISTSLNLREIVVEVGSINKILGIIVPNEEILRILNGLNIKSSIENNILHCVAPLYRDDLENANDLAEEVIRMYGYDNINCTLMSTSKQKSIDCSEITHINKSKDILIGHGLNECYTYSFTSPKMFNVLRLEQDNKLRDVVALLNPLGENLSIMRTTLAYNMLEVMSKNINRSNKCLRLFEYANVYLPKSLPLTELPNEFNHVIIGVTGENEDFYTIKGILENFIGYFNNNIEYKRCSISYMHAGISAEIFCNNQYVGYVGEVHPNVIAELGIKEKLYIAELNYDILVANYDSSYQFIPIPKFPSVERDLAVLVKESVTSAELMNCVKNSAGKMLNSVDIFDIYRGKGIAEGLKSVAFKMQFGALDRTLVDDEINAKIDKVIKKLDIELGAKLR